MRSFTATTFLLIATSIPLTAQEAAPTSNRLFQHEVFYPQETIAAFGLNSIDPHRAEFEKTGLFRLLVNSPEMERILPTALAKVSLVTGLSRDQLEALLGSGFSIGLTGWRMPNEFDFMGIIELGDSASKIHRLLSRSFESTGSAAGVETYATAFADGIELTFCFPGSTLLFASSRTQIDGSLARWANPALPSMASSPRFKRITSQLMAEDSTQPLVAGYLDLGLTIDGLLRLVPEENQDTVNKIIDNLNLRQASAFGYSALPGDGRITDHLRVSMIAEPTGILAAFLPRVGKLDPEFNRFVPADVSAYALTHIRFDQLFEQTLKTIGVFDNNIASQARMMMRGLASQTGVDIEGDLFGSFGQRVLTLQWPVGTDGAADFAVLLELSNETRFDGALRKLGMLKHSAWQGFQIYSAPDTVKVGGNSVPSLGIGQRFCVLAGSRARLEAVLKHLTAPPENVKAKALFSAQVEGTIATGWTNLGEMMQSYGGLFSRVEQFADQAGAATFQSTFERLASVLGDSETSVIRNQGGISFISRSATGNLGGLLIGALSAASAGLSTQTVSSAPPVKPDDRAELELFRSLLTEVTVSELVHRESGREVFADLQTLVDSGAIETSLLGENLGSGTFDQGSHLLKVFLPAAESERSEKFLVIAWPHDAETGNVYACREDGLPLVNNLLARADGIAEIQLRDVFVGGSFAGKMTPGWRRLEGMEMAVTQSTSEAVADREVFEQILLAEESGKGDPMVLIPILESANPKLVSRAAYAMGKLQMSEAVPDLIKILGTHSDPSVRRFAMNALKDLRDPRTIQASAAALMSDDLQVRRLAAENLGRLRRPEAVDPLLSFLAGDMVPVADEERPDRVQAILALCDIGEQSSLLATATSIHAGSPAEEEALTYMFQMFTGKLEPHEEATTLMTVLDHEGLLLRRYAIQRLGELKDRTTIPALEERLALEGPQLRPLVQLALQGMLGESSTGPRVGSNYAIIKLKQWQQQAVESWQGLERGDRNKLVAGTTGGTILMVSLLFIIRRRRRQKRSEEWISEMVAPSAEDEYEEGEYEEEDFDAETPVDEFEEAPASLQLPPEAAMPTGDGWEHAELGVAAGEEEGEEEGNLEGDGFIR